MRKRKIRRPKRPADFATRKEEKIVEKKKNNDIES